MSSDSPPGVNNPKRSKSLFKRLRRIDQPSSNTPSSSSFSSSSSPSSSTSALMDVNSSSTHSSAIPIPMPIPLPTPVSEGRNKVLTKEKEREKNTKDKEREREREKEKNKWDKKASRKAPPPPISQPPQLFVELTRQVRRVEEDKNNKGERKEDEYDMDEIEWERIKTLPRVRLVPPEDEGGSPITLYPPPQPRKPLLSFPLDDHLSAPTAPLFLDPSPHQNPPIQHQQQRRSWTGMESGFATPTPVFRRTGGGGGFGRSGSGIGVGGVVMPKRREEVVAGMEMRRRSVVVSESETEDGRGSLEGRRSTEKEDRGNVPREMAVAGEKLSDGYQGAEETMPVVDALLTEATTTAPKDVSADTTLTDQDETSQDRPTSAIADNENAPTIVPQPVPVKSTILPVRPQPSRAPSAPEPVTKPLPPRTEDTIDPNPIAPYPKRITRAMSLTSHLASKVHPVIPHHDDYPPLPPIPAVLRKQKSLKMFFFSSSATQLEGLNQETEHPSRPSHPNLPSPPPGVAIQEKRAKGLLSRAKSKPSLRIDVKAAKANTNPSTPALTTGTTISSNATSPTIPITPTSVDEPKHRGLSKRFSLSNMSSAFKKSKSHNQSLAGGGGFGSGVEGVPAVPDLPDVYKRENGVKGGGKANVLVKESAVPIGPVHRDREPLPDKPSEESIVHQPLTGAISTSTTLDSAILYKQDEKSVKADNLSETFSAFDLELDQSSISSISHSPTSSPIYTAIESTSAPHTQLQHVSPRTRRDPSVSLQEFLGTVQKPQKGIMVSREGGVRHSVEGIILGPLLSEIGLAGVEEGVVEKDFVEGGEEEKGMSREGNSIDSLASIESAPPITPSIALHNPLSPPPIIQDTLPTKVETMTPPQPTKPAGKTPSPTSKLFNSPESFLRKLSPRTASRLAKAQQTQPPTTSTSTVSEKVVVGPILPPLPPIPVDVAFSAISGDVQLKSLHFDGLGLDFDGYSWIGGEASEVPA